MPLLSRKKRIALLLVGIGAVLWVANTAYRSLSQRKIEPEPGASTVLSQGMSMPEDISFEGLDGKRSTLAGYKGRVVLINFWAGWCGPCLHEMPSLYEMQKRLETKGLAVLGMNMDDDPQAGLRALKKAAGEAPFPIFRGAHSPLVDRFAIDGLPFTVVLDKNLRIVYAQAGEVDWSGTEARDLVEGLL